MPLRPIQQVVTPSVAFLRSIAMLELPAESLAPLGMAARQIFGSETARTPWQQLVNDAERHGLAALLFRHLGTLAVEPPPQIHQQLQSLRIRHRRANAARAKALTAILDTFDAQGIRSALLKGAALVNEIYPEPSMRPMSDIDILVAPAEVHDAQRCLLKMGYRAEATRAGPLFNHHHLPMAATVIDGVPVRVEIHRDALSGDVDSSISMDSLSEPLRIIALPDRNACALGHVDTLRHLCHHTFEPIAEIKLGAIVDLYGYASHHVEHLDRSLIDHRYPFVRNIFQLLSVVTPLPDALESWVRPGEVPAPDGAGFGYPPMSEILSAPGNHLTRVAGLLRAPDWWLHGFYNVAPGHSIAFTKYLRHPLQVTKWLTRRARATVQHRRATRQNTSGSEN